MMAQHLGKSKGEYKMKNEIPLEYQMSKTLFDSYLKTRKEKDKKLNPYVYVMGVINEEFNLRGTVKHLFIYD